MKHVIACMRALCPISDETVKELESLVVKCNYPKRYQLIKENIFCRYAYFIEKGIMGHRTKRILRVGRKRHQTY